MPTPYILTVKVDIWSANTDQKLQILEQLLMMFNPSLEIQTTDNFVDWTSLSVVDLQDVNFSSKTIPVGVSSEIDVAALTLQTPIWISPPAKVKRLGIVTGIISNIFNSAATTDNYISGLGDAPTTTSFSDHLFTSNSTLGNYDITVQNKSITATNGSNDTLLSWASILSQIPGKYQAGLTTIFLKADNGTEIIGQASINPLDDRILSISEWNVDTYPSNTLLPGPARANSAWGSFDAIIDPLVNAPSNLVNGTRYMLVNNIGSGVKDEFLTTSNIQRISTGIEFNKVKDFEVTVDGVLVGATIQDSNGLCLISTNSIVPIDKYVRYVLYFSSTGPTAWKNTDLSDLIAATNDIIEWTGDKWEVVFSAAASTNQLLYLTNLYSMSQYQWNGVSWVKSVDGVYKKGDWRIAL